MSDKAQPLPNMVRTLRRALGGHDRFGAQPFAAASRAFEVAANNVRYFYLASALYVWIYLPIWHQMVINDPPIDLMWPLLWAQGLPILSVVDTLGVACASFAILAFWKPGVLIWRAAFAGLFLMCAAIPASMGGVGHHHHEWFWIAFIFIFLPAGASKEASRATKMAYTMTFAAAQGLILMFYSMAGFWKTWSGIQSLVAGEPGNFHPYALAWTLADRMAQTNTEPLLGPFMVDNPVLGWPSFLFVMYAQLVAIAIAFRPSLHRIWAFALIAFHTGTFVLMEIPFPSHIAVLMVLFVASPFQREDWVRPQTLYHMPIVGDLARYFQRSRKPALPSHPVPEAA